MKKLIITGGLGLIGSHLASIFVNDDVPYEVHVVDIQRNFLPFNLRTQFDSRRLEMRQNLVTGCTVHNIDTRHAFEVGDLIRSIRPDYLIHLAALPLANISNDISEEASGTVISATLTLMELIRRFSPYTKLVFASSSMVYGNFQQPLIDEDHPTKPMSIYGAVKLAGEVLVEGFCRKNELQYCIIRPSAVYGPTDLNRRVVQAFLDDARRGLPLVINGRDSVLDFTYVDDIATGFFLGAIKDESAGEIFNVTSSDPHTIGQLAELIMDYFPTTEMIYREHERGVPKRGGLDVSRAKEKLGYIPKYTLKEGLDKYINQEKMNG